MPHYNAGHANIFLKKKLGNLYNYDSGSVWKSFFKCAGMVTVKDNGEGVWRF
jgi:hypothetical protein